MSTPPRPGTSPARLIAAVVAGLEAAGLLGLAVAYGAGVASAKQADLGRSLASMALFVAGAVLLIMVARAWLTGLTWPRMASLVWNALLVPVSFSVISGNGVAIGGPLLLLAVAGVVSALLVPDERHTT